MVDQAVADFVDLRCRLPQLGTTVSTDMDRWLDRLQEWMANGLVVQSRLRRYRKYDPQG
jgi:hypothetical protein